MLPNLHSSYEVYALRFASWHERNASDFFHRYQLYGIEDRSLRMDCFFWLIRNNERTVLVDTGYDLARARSRRGRQHDNDPLELLSRFDVSPEDVDHVVISHMHFDHIGNLGLFPNATFSVARAELEYWTGPYGDQPAIAYPSEPEEVQAVMDLARAERLQLVEESAEPFAGIRLTRVGGHTPGQLITEVDGGSEHVVLASDSIHYYEEMEHDRPFFLYTDLEDMFRTYGLLRELAERPGTSVVAGHDPRVMDRFAAVDVDCVDLTKPTARAT